MKYLLIILLMTSCANLKELDLYQAEVKSNEGINGFTSIDIFSTGGTDEVWGNADQECNPLTFSLLDASFDYPYTKDIKNSNKANKLDDGYDYGYVLPSIKVDDEKKKLKNSLHIKTDYPASCNWIGMGIGWDAWKGKDLTRIIEGAAIEFMARVDKGPIFNIPIVFILEDYSANQCYATASYLGIEGGEITNSWTKVTIPLPTFSYSTNNIDLSNVKQLLLQCYDKVDIYIDEIKIVEHKHNYKKFSNDLTIYDTIYPVNIFSDKNVTSWGLDNIYCENFKILNKKNDLRGDYIDVNISDNCNWRDFAISWNNWLYTDLSSSIYAVDLEFDLKINNLSKAIISFEDYSGKKMSVSLLDYIEISDFKEWNVFKVPLKKFPIRSSKINLKEIKNIIFSFSDDADLKIDNIKLTK